MIRTHIYHGAQIGNIKRFSIGRFLLLAAIYMALLVPSMAATLLPNGEQTFVDANGSPLNAGTVDFYVPGTFTRKNTWNSSTTTNPNLNSNPVVLDSAGRTVIYGIGCYRQIVKDVSGNQQWDKTTCSNDSNSDSWGGTATGTPNAIIVTANNFTGADGQVIRFVAAANNSGPTTVNPSVAGVPFGNVTVVVDSGGGPVACSGNEIVTGNVVTLVYDANLGVFHLSTLTSVTAGPGLSTSGVGSQGGTGATSVTLTSVQPVNSQGIVTSYTLQASDLAKLVTTNNSSANLTVTLPVPTGSFAAGFWADYLNLNNGVATLAPVSGTVNGVATLSVPYKSGGRLVSDGSNWYLVNGSSGNNTSSIGYTNLQIVNTTGQENDHITITAGALTLRRGTGFSYTVVSVNVVCNYSTTFASGGSLDTGVLTTNSWYYHYVISNGTTTACLGSLSSTSPTLPAGYFFNMRVGANRTNGSSQFNRVIQYNEKAEYQVVAGSPTTAMPVIASGSTGACTTGNYTAFSMANFAPPTAGRWMLMATNYANAGALTTICAAPSNTFSGGNSANPPPISGDNTGRFAMSFDWNSVTGSVYFSSNSTGGALFAKGWFDNL